MPKLQPPENKADKINPALTTPWYDQTILVDHVSDAIIATDQHFRILSWNRAAETVYGWSAAEAQGQLIDELIPPTYLNSTPETVLEDFARDGRWQGEVLQPTRTKKVRYFLASVTAVFDEHQTVIGTIAVNRDITDRKKVEAALYESESRYRKLFESAAVGLGISSRTGRIITMNRATQTITGYNPDDFATTQITSLYANPTDRHKFLSILQRDGQVDDFEAEFVHKSGNFYWCSISAIPITYEGEAAILTTILDITHRKQTEQLTHRYEFIVNTSHELMTLIDREYQYAAASKAFCQAHNKPASDVVGMSVAQVWGETAYRQSIKPTLDRAFRGEQPTFEGWIEFAQLGRRYVDVTYYPYYNTRQALTHVVVVSRDITDHKTAFEQIELYANNLDAEIAVRQQTELTLQELLVENDQLISAIPLILIAIDHDCKVSHWNSPAETIFGVKASNAIGRQMPTLDLDINWHLLQEAFEKCRRIREPISLHDLRFGGSRQHEGFLNLVITPYGGDQTHQGLLILGEDVTQRRLLEEELVQAQKLQAIGQLAAGVAHEINTPTQFIGDNIRFIKTAFDKLTEVLESYQTFAQEALNGEVSAELAARIDKLAAQNRLAYLLDEIPFALADTADGVERVAEIVQAMKAFSHPGVKEKTPVDLNQAIDSTITIARNEWKYVADVNTNFDPTLPLVLCHPGEFNQTILNLLVNAAHAIGENTKTTGTEKGLITVSTLADGDWVEIRVQDNGPGIPEDIRFRIFEPFFTTKDIGEGTGQGLAIAHDVIVQKHGGTLSVETERGQGATFIIRLPVALDSEDV